MQRTLRLVNEQPLSPTATDRPLDFCMALILYARFCFYTNRLDTGVCFTNCESFYARLSILPSWSSISVEVLILTHGVRLTHFFCLFASVIFPKLMLTAPIRYPLSDPLPPLLLLLLLFCHAVTNPSHHHHIAAMSYAVGCGLHQIDLRPVPLSVTGRTTTISATAGTATGGTAGGAGGNATITTASGGFDGHGGEGNNSNHATGVRFFPPPRDEHEAIQRIRLWHSIFIVRPCLAITISRFFFEIVKTFLFFIITPVPSLHLSAFPFRVVCPRAFGPRRILFLHFSLPLSLSRFGLRVPAELNPPSTFLDSQIPLRFCARCLCLWALLHLPDWLGPTYLDPGPSLPFCPAVPREGDV